MPQFDQWGLTFIVSSWLFGWEAAAFEWEGKNGGPMDFDHGAHVPIVSVCTPRRGWKAGGGVNVYFSGTRAFCEAVARRVLEGRAGSA